MAKKPTICSIVMTMTQTVTESVTYLKELLVVILSVMMHEIFFPNALLNRTGSNTSALVVIRVTLIPEMISSNTLSKPVRILELGTPMEPSW